MNLNTDHLKRCIQTLRSSLGFYAQAAPDSIDQEIYRNAIVKGYELVQGTNFKLIKNALRDFGYGKKTRCDPRQGIATPVVHPRFDDAGRSRVLVCLPR